MTTSIDLQLVLINYSRTGWKNDGAKARECCKRMVENLLAVTSVIHSTFRGEIGPCSDALASGLSEGQMTLCEYSFKGFNSREATNN